jgi:hypothetical protein
LEKQKAQERARQKKQEAWKMEWKRIKKEDFPTFRQRKLEIYDFYENSNFSGVPPGTQQVRTEKPRSLDGLDGKYKIVFHWGDNMMISTESRAVHNSFLTLERKGNELSAKVVFDQDFFLKDDDNWIFHMDFAIGNFARMSHNCIYSDSVECNVEELKEEFQLYFCGANASLKVLKDRVALPWLPKEIYEDDDHGSDREDWLDDDAPVKFDSLEEADELMKVYENGHGDGDWLCRHKGLSPDLARHIHDYVSWKPRPVLFLEAGDLVLNVEWHESTADGGVWSTFVARKAED